MKQNTGISLIALIITIAIIIIIASVTLQGGLKRTDDARIAAHNHTITQMEEEVQNYYYYNGGQLPILKDALNNDTLYTLQTGTALETEISRNGDGGDKLYVIDINKLGGKNGKQGTGLGNDIFIVTENRHNVYYVKGDTIKGITYYGRIAKNALALTNQNFANPPKLSQGMTPVKWDGSTWVSADVNNLNNDWYNYTKGINKWANVKLADGSMLVWIPRYTYKILNNEHTATAGDIDIRFSKGINDDITNGYREHPAFYWGGWNIPRSAPMTRTPGGVEVTGIWVGKFEPSDAGSGKIQIKAGYVAMTNLTVDSIFVKCMNMQNIDNGMYGITNSRSIADFHMMKNSEWGAVSYLSKYAMGNIEVAMNNDAGYFTSGINDTNGLGVRSNRGQSTSGNEYGIFDMSGCSWEYLASYTNNGQAATNANSLVNALNSYKDLLPVGVTDSSADNYDALNYAYGHAIYEISSVPSIWNGSTWDTIKFGWFDDIIYIRHTSWPIIIRGGNVGFGTSGGLFSLSFQSGFAASYQGFRLSAIVK